MSNNQGCKYDNDKDGNCHLHPDGCPFVMLEPLPTNCAFYTNGSCCWDRHYRANNVIKSATVDLALCELKSDNSYGIGRLTDDKETVNCKDCRELIHS